MKQGALLKWHRPRVTMQAQDNHIRLLHGTDLALSHTSPRPRLRLPFINVYEKQAYAPDVPIEVLAVLFC